MNLVIAGHISSDTLGMNLILDRIESQGVEVFCTSGIVRVWRSSEPAPSRRPRSGIRGGAFVVAAATGDYGFGVEVGFGVLVVVPPLLGGFGLGLAAAAAALAASDHAAFQM
jgi:hypothetical protein